MNFWIDAFAWRTRKQSWRLRIAHLSNALRVPLNPPSLQTTYQPSHHPSTTPLYTKLYRILRSWTGVVITETLRDFDLVKYGNNSQRVKRLLIHYLNELKNKRVDLSAPNIERKRCVCVYFPKQNLHALRRHKPKSNERRCVTTVGSAATWWDCKC